MELLAYRRTAAEIAAAAVYELYPDVELLGGEVTSLGFSYDFLFPHPIHVHVIERKMRSIIQERRPIKTLEMVPFSAKEYLRSKGLFERADAVDEDQMVELFQMGEFIDLSIGPHLKNSFDLAAFKIEAVDLGEKKMRITGWCHRSKSDLKQFLKILSRYKSPQKKGEELGYWKGDVWFEPGLRVREGLIDFLKKEWFQDAWVISGSLDADREELHRRQNRKKVAEIYPLSSSETVVQISFFDQMIEDWNSCLQMIGKTLTILGFDHSSISMGSLNDFVVADELSVSHLLVRAKKREKGSKLEFSFRAVVEMFLLQRIEKNLYDGLS